MSSSLVVTDEDRVRVLRLNRPDRLNALDPELRRLLVEALKDAGTDDGVRTVLITGTGERGFCAGQDLNESMALDEDSSAQWMASWKDYFQTFLRFPKPLVAAVNGVRPTVRVSQGTPLSTTLSRVGEIPMRALRRGAQRRQADSCPGIRR